MPEHVHLLLTEPERTKLSIALQMLKQNVARRLHGPEGTVEIESHWTARKRERMGVPLPDQLSGIG
jgi:REP element-mobilizing transposase RayT